MNRPLVSIAVLTYNHEKFITQTIESFLQQKTDFDCEIVIGDDASTDGTQKILTEFLLKYPKKFNISIHTSNIGMIPNFINTIERCKGKYIAFCEGDDYWIDNEKLQIQIDFLESNNNYGICFHDAKIYDETLKALKSDDITSAEKEEYDLDDLVNGNFMHTPTVVIRNDFSLPEDFSMLPIGDWPLYILMLNQRKIKKIKKEMAVYRVHSQSAWSSKSLAYRIERTITTIEYLLETVDLNTSRQSTLKNMLKGFKKELYKLTTPLFKRLKLDFLSLFKTN